MRQMTARTAARTMAWAAAVWLVLAAATALAATWTVAKDGTGDFTSIQQAIDYAFDGDTILVAPGVYAEDIFYNSRAVTISSLDPDDPAVVQATVIQGTVTFDFLEGPDSILMGMTITPRYSFEETPVSIAPGMQMRPSIFEDVVVWLDDQYTLGEMRLCAKKLSTGEEFVVTSLQNLESEVAIYGDIVIWTDFKNNESYDIDIYGKNLSTGDKFVVCAASENQIKPVIYGNHVAWLDFRDGWENIKIYVKNLSTHQELSIPKGGMSWMEDICLFQNLIIWLDASQDGGIGLYGMDINNSEKFLIHEGGIAEFDFHGNIVVWTEMINGSTALFGKKLYTEDIIPIFFGECTNPQIYNNLVIWLDGRYGGDNIYIFGKNLVTNELNLTDFFS